MDDSCGYDYGFKPNNREESIWAGVNCAKPFEKPDKLGCNPSYDITSSYNDPDKASLTCAYTKWKWKGDKKSKNPKVVFKRKVRKSKMKNIMIKICNSDKEYCPDKITTPRDEICDKTKACDDESPNLSGIPRDVKYFAKIVLEAFSKENLEKKLSSKKKITQILED